MFLAKRPMNTSLNNSLLESIIGKKLKLTASSTGGKTFITEQIPKYIRF
jgi:hypothetical protein